MTLDDLKERLRTYAQKDWDWPDDGRNAAEQAIFEYFGDDELERLYTAACVASLWTY